MGATATIEVDEFLPYPPDVVWRALTDSDRLAAWLMPNDFEPEIGHRFAFATGRWGTTGREVLDMQPERLLRFSWRNGPLDTEVTWRLEPEGNGTRLFLQHCGFDLDHPMPRFAYDSMSDGWRSEVIPSLTGHLAAPDSGPSR